MAVADGALSARGRKFGVLSTGRKPGPNLKVASRGKVPPATRVGCRRLQLRARRGARVRGSRLARWREACAVLRQESEQQARDRLGTLLLTGVGRGGYLRGGLGG